MTELYHGGVQGQVLPNKSTQTYLVQLAINVSIYAWGVLIDSVFCKLFGQFIRRQYLP